MKISIIGNCQAQVIQKIIKLSTGEDFDVPIIKPVHMLSPEDLHLLHNDVSTSNILITQLISDNYRGFKIGTNQLRKLLPLGAKCLIIPNIHWEGYFPSLTYLKDDHGQHVSPRNARYSMFMHDYHDSIVVASRLLNIPYDRLSIFYDKADYFYDWVIFNLEYSFKQLKDRETNCDIKVSDYIFDNYKYQQQFWSFNHPCNLLLEYFLGEIFKKIGLDGYHLNLNGREFLKDFVFPIFPFVIKGLKINFEPSNFILKGRKMNYNEFLLNSWIGYEKNPKIVYLNSSNEKVLRAMKYIKKI